jgi:hypothetical protein
MILKTFSCRKPGDPDYLAPEIQLVNKDLFLVCKFKPNRIIEVVSLNE